MKNGIKMIAALSMAIAGMLGTSVMCNHVTAQMVLDCNCGQAACTSCQINTQPACTSCESGCNEPSCKTCRAPAARITGVVGRVSNRVTTRGRRSICGTCRTDCGSIQCPSCDGDVCKLELDKGKSKKTCFKVEQKVVCIPPVRLPWAKCCPPGLSRKTRTINVLKKHSYECPSCSYKWSLQEPEVAKPAEPAKANTPDTYQPPVQPPQDADWYVPKGKTIEGTVLPVNGK